MTGPTGPRDDVTQGSEASVKSRTVEQATPARRGAVAPVIALVAWWALCAFVVYFIGVSAGWW